MRLWLRRISLVFAVLIALALVTTLIFALWARNQVRNSLAQLDGQIIIDGLEAPVEIDRDALGVVTIRGSSRLDIARATGFVHAQERFFQMDLSRKQAAGELAELFGEGAADWDREIRHHRFRDVAERVITTISEGERQHLEAYAAGVNCGLHALDAPPFEYLLLRTTPEEWQNEDTVLTILSMFITLQSSDGAADASLGLVHDLLPDDMYQFLTPIGTSWDAPVEGEAIETPPLPASSIALATQITAAQAEDPPTPGSNAWAVAGQHTVHGGALLANDMHLGIRVPNTWFRASFEWPGDDGPQKITGVTLPGAPAIIVGSNSHIAWGFTNSYGDYVDLVDIETDPNNKERYRTADGWKEFTHHQETVNIKGGVNEIIDVTETVWGPVIDVVPNGRSRALRWTAHDPEAINFDIGDLEGARTLDEALEIAARTGIPGQNFVCADSTGRIGWTIMGRIPARTGCDGRIPTDMNCSWQGWVPPEAQPRIVDPPGGRIWTANARVISGEDLNILGDGGYDIGARAGQIRDGLLAINKASESDMLELQLDDRALFLERWQELILRVLDNNAIEGEPVRAEARRLVEGWGARAGIDSVGYRIVRAFRLTVRDTVIGGLTQSCRDADPDFRIRHLGQVEDSLWQLLTEQPPQLLPPRTEGWQELLLESFDQTVAELLENCGSLDTCTWGKRNTTSIQHPLSRAVPMLSRWLDMPPQALPGDSKMPRVQSPTFGSSERLVVSPGRESEGFFHMPCGQSGHPFSPYYRAGHEAWAKGEATPFLPGPSEHTLTCLPQ